MADIALNIDNLGKKYLIRHHNRASYFTLREAIAGKVKNVVRHFSHHRSLEAQPTVDTVNREDFWALKDVSFRVGMGEVVGIIGCNGAGKSTLLKLLSRITRPSTGRIQIRGRIVSLLEVGTGFHPELTGRENIFLNGAILGMTKTEIKHKFDEIVAFSEIKKFLDTPVKRYSSGMYVRLAFAVAAHLEPEILLIDEVLAVGDAQFQKKCLGKMKEVGQDGRTVIFVSHNMQAIRQLCDRAILLNGGRKIYDGEPAKAIGDYLYETTRSSSIRSLDDILRDLPPDPVFKLESIFLRQNGKKVGKFVETAYPLEVEIGYRIFQRTRGLRVYFDLYDDQDVLLFRSFHDEDNDGIPTVDPGLYVSSATIPMDFLGPIRYELRIRAGIFNVRSCLPTSGICIPIEVEMTGRYNRAYLGDTFRGRLALAIDWKTEKRSRDA